MRSSGFTSTAVAPRAPGSANFLVPSGMETGAAKLYVVANGVASKPVAVTVN